MVTFEPRTLYQCFTVINQQYRGRGVGQAFMRFLLGYYGKHPSYDYIVLITRASNGANINVSMKNGAMLVGIVELKNLMGCMLRKEVYMNRKLKKWS